MAVDNSIKVKTVEKFSTQLTGIVVVVKFKFLKNLKLNNI